MNIPFSPPDITECEINAVNEVLRSGWITTGPKTKEFEKQISKYVNTPNAVCLNSATACMELTLRLLGVGPGDEVITSAYTYTASASVVCHIGATLVLVDTAKDSYEMDYNKLEKVITERTKVIIPVELAGVICDYEKIYQIINMKKHLFQPQNNLQEAFGRIIIMSDAAHAFGATYQKKVCGDIADFTNFSFHAVKNITTAEGGAVVWKEIPGIENDWIYKQYMLMSLHGQSKDALAKTQLGAWEYDIISPAFKCNMTDIMAAIGLAQLKRYAQILERRKEIILKYSESFKALPIQMLIHYGDNFSSSGHLFLVRLLGKNSSNRDDLIVNMAQLGISTNVHYKPLPMFTAYKNLGFRINDFPNAFFQYQNEITLPLHTCLSNEEINFIIKSFMELVYKI